MPSRPSSRSFTLVEVLVAVALAILLLAALFSMMGQVSGVWRRSTGSIEAFQGARVGFDLMGRNLSQATLNAYVDYDNVTNPAYYLRKSDLRFVVGAAGNGIPGTAGTGQAVFFQAPLHNVSTASRTSLDTLLNTCGYYVSFTTNATVPAHVAGTQNPYRYRLMQMLVPSEGNTIYGCTTNPSVIDLLARQEAVSKNREVEVRFYSFPVNGAAGWRAAQVFRVEQASGAASLVPVDRVVPLPNGIVISSSAALSPLLSADASIQGTVVLPGYGSATYAGFRYRPDGSTGSVVTSANNFLTFQEANDPASPPKNYCTLQINPVTGKVSSYRP